MGELQAASSSVSPLVAILWCFYPIGALVLIELIMRAINDDDDDQDGGKGIRVDQMQPAYAPSPSWLIGHTNIGDLLNDGMVV